MNTKKINLALLYGGISIEHEISLRSTTAVLQNIDYSLFEVFPIAIDKESNWHFVSMDSIKESLKEGKEIHISKEAPLCSLVSEKKEGEKRQAFLKTEKSTYLIDVLFPMIHGVPGENGYIQGFCETLQIPYVGAGVLASSICMDKEIAKRLVSREGVAIIPYICARPRQDKLEEVEKRIQTKLTYPVFIKPASLGSSIAASPVNNSSELKLHYEKAAEYDSKILIEKKMKGREIELAVLGSKEDFQVSIPGEIIYREDFPFFSYQAKYSKEIKEAPIKVPAELDSKLVIQFKKLTKKIFSCLECEGMARVDFFLGENNAIYFNEINTIPGCSSFSIFPALWKYEGITYKELISKLIKLSLHKNNNFN